VSRRKAVNIPIAVEFGHALDALHEAAGRQGFENQLAGRLEALLAEFGIPGKLQVSFHAGKTSRALSVKVHQTRLFPSVELMQRIWLALAPQDLHDLIDAPAGETQPTGLDGWFAGYAAGLEEAKEPQAWDLALRYLARLVVELLRQKPASLLSQAQTAEYLRAGFARFPGYRWPGSGEPETAAAVMGFLQALLDLGVSLQHQETILFVLNAGLQLGRSLEDSLESAILRLRSNRIEIHANALDFQSVVEGNVETELLPVNAGQVSQEFQEGIQYVMEVLFTELGVRQPDITLAISTASEPGVVAFKINDVLSPPVRLIGADEALVNAGLDVVKGLGVEARTGRVPVTGLGAAIVAKNDQETLQQQGYRTWNWLGYIHIALANELRQRAAWLVSLEDVEYQMAQLEPDYPQLVYAVMELYTMEDVTRILRGLAAENVPIRDLRAVFEPLLRYDAIPVDGSDLQVMDARLPIAYPGADGSTTNWTRLLKYVRKEMREQITEFVTYGTNSLEVYLLGERLERYVRDWVKRLEERPADPGQSDLQEEPILEAVRACVSRLSPAAEWPVLVTGIELRRFLRRLVELEFPRLRVAAFHDLAAGVQANVVDHIEIS